MTLGELLQGPAIVASVVLIPQSDTLPNLCLKTLERKSRRIWLEWLTVLSAQCSVLTRSVGPATVAPHLSFQIFRTRILSIFTAGG